MNPHSDQPISFGSMVKSLFGHRALILPMVRREVAGRYRGSMFGALWSLLTPLLMLVVYTFVFSVVFKARWGGHQEAGHASFAIALFAGIIVHGVFAEVANKSPALIVKNSSYVKRVVFPLETLVPITLLAALFHAGVSLVVLVLAILLTQGTLPWTTPLVVLVWLPLIALSLGAGWLLAALGVYVRDIDQAIGVFTTVLMFLSPVFFSLDALPPEFRSWVELNPLSLLIEQTRAVLIFGHLPDWLPLAKELLGTVLFAWAGYAWFQLTRRGFADVI